jgi:3-mercaptopyruvate sulfurtransferase SseA
MKKLLLLLSSITIVFGLEIPKNHLVDSNWLEKNQNEKNLVIIDTREKADYEKGHIKNAVNYSKNEWNKGTTIEIPKLYNTPTQIEEMAKKAGISKDSIVVFYSAGKEDTDFENAATAMWSLWIYGFENSVILDGGFEKWLSEKRVVFQRKGEAWPSNHCLQVKKVQKKKIANHIAANDKDPEKKTLFIAEGLSASSMGLSVRDPKYHGFYSLRGKVLNTHDMSAYDILKNKELSELVAIIGLDLNSPSIVDEEGNSILNYGRIAL